MYREICESIEPYVPNRHEIDIIKVTPDGENLAELVNLVLDKRNALVIATKGGGGKSYLLTATAVELQKQNKNVVFLLPMHKHKDTIIKKGKLFNVEFKHKEDIYLYADIVNKNSLSCVRCFRISTLLF